MLKTPRNRSFRDTYLDQERVGILEINVHNSHHAHTHELSSENLLEFAGVVGMYRRSNELGFIGTSHRCWLDIFEGSHICSVLAKDVLEQATLHYAQNLYGFQAE